MKRQLLSTPHLMILPSLLLAILIIGYPVVDLAWTSLHEVSRFGQTRGFDGLANYADVLSDPLFYGSLWRTIIWTVTVVGGALIISLPVAIILNDDFIGRGIARVIVMLPWAISLTMTAVVWRWASTAAARHAERHALIASISSPAQRVARHRQPRLPGRDRHRHPRLDPLHRRRSSWAASPPCRATSTRPRGSTAPSPGSASAT